MSSLSFIVMLLIMIIIPTIFYTFFFIISCPPNPLHLLRRSSRESKMEEEKENDESNQSNIDLVVAVSSKLGLDTECPVCLSVFAEGEELKQLKICKHLFHKPCIDKWLSSHFNCPVCRAFVASQTKPKEKRDA